MSDWNNFTGLDYDVNTYTSRKTGLQLPSREKQFFRAMLFFRAEASSQKWKNKYIFIFIKRKKQNSFRLARWTARDLFLARDSKYAIARYMLSPVRHTGGSVEDGWS